MKTYIALLRGINVSGQKRIMMNALRESLKNAGFENIITYVQSGNIVFSANDESPDAIEQIITKKIEADFGYEVPVIVLTTEDLKKITGNNALLNDPHKNADFMHITFLSAVPESYHTENIDSRKIPGEEIIFSNRAIYLYCPFGYGRTKLTNSFLEARLRVTATTRNWKTVKELLKLALETDAIP
jgi:uncharacterized protein (DUF1697 family)